MSKKGLKELLRSKLYFGMLTAAVTESPYPLTVTDASAKVLEWIRLTDLSPVRATAASTLMWPTISTEAVG